MMALEPLDGQDEVFGPIQETWWISSQSSHAADSRFPPLIPQS